MLELYESFTVTDKSFLYAAVFGGFFLILKAGLSLIGANDATDGSLDDSLNADGSFDAHSTVGDFHLFTIQGLTSCLMLGGLAGLFFSRSLGLSSLISIVGALFAGYMALYLNALLMRLLSSLQSSGTLNMNNAIDKEGEVYLTVKSHGGGQVQLELQGRLMICDAKTESSEDIPTGERVLVCRVINGKTLLVSKL